VYGDPFLWVYYESSRRQRSEGVKAVRRVGMVRLGIYLSEVQVKRIKTIAKKRGLTVSEIIRRMIDEGQERYEKSREKK
jgi:predicted DNA-binding ribbon-helix-helix protein